MLSYFSKNLAALFEPNLPLLPRASFGFEGGAIVHNGIFSVIQKHMDWKKAALEGIEDRAEQPVIQTKAINLTTPFL